MDVVVSVLFKVPVTVNEEPFAIVKVPAVLMSNSPSTVAETILVVTIPIVTADAIPTTSPLLTSIANAVEVGAVVAVNQLMLSGLLCHVFAVVHVPPPVPFDLKKLAADVA